MKIGNLEISYAAIPAPLASITDIVFRKLLDEIGYAGYMVTEMISAEGLRRRQRKTLDIIEPGNFQFKTPQFIQLFGSNPAQFTDAVKFIENETKFSGIDINMGCPAPKINRKGGGAALLKEPLKAGTVIREVRMNTKLPVTVKLRLGYDSVNIMEMVKIAESEGVDGIAIHFRLRSDGYTGHARWEMASAIKECLQNKTVFIGNGDIKTAEEALEKLKIVDGVMIGRGSVINPFIFGEIAGCSLSEKDMNWAYRRALELIEFYYPPVLHLAQFKAYARFFFSNRPNSKKIRQQIYTCRTFEELKQCLDEQLERGES